MLELSNNTKAIVTVNLKENKGVYFVQLNNNKGIQITKRVIIK